MNLIRLESDVCHSFTAADSPLIIPLLPYLYCMFGRLLRLKVTHIMDACLHESKPRAVFVKTVIWDICKCTSFIFSSTFDLKTYSCIKRSWGTSQSIFSSFIILIFVFESRKLNLNVTNLESCLREELEEKKDQYPQNTDWKSFFLTALIIPNYLPSTDHCFIIFINTTFEYADKYWVWGLFIFCVLIHSQAMIL